VSGEFAEWQPAYCERGLATFPIVGKRPAVRNWQRIGCRASFELASQGRFGSAEAFGLSAGARSGITALDIDSADERLLVAALDRHGNTPIVVRTASGKFHAWYRHNGERRRIRPWKPLPIDLIGQGVLVAPPSRLRTREGSARYEFIEGGLDDVDRLPAMRNVETDARPPGFAPVLEGERNHELWRHCMRQAGQCEDLAALLAETRAFNANCEPPLSEAEVAKTAASAWRYETSGRNRFGGKPTLEHAAEKLPIPTCQR
jgi:hypothetical protein